MHEIQRLNHILQLYKLDASCIHSTQYKRSRTYDIELKPGCRVKTIQKYLNEISMALKATSIPTMHILTHRGLVQLEYILPNHETLNLFDLSTSCEMATGFLPCLLGETCQGLPLWIDLTETPHMIVAGTTGSGKSTVLHNLIANLIPQNTQLYLIDPKHIEFTAYKDGFKTIQVSSEYQDSLMMLNNIMEIMEHRFTSTLSHQEYPFIVVMIDEFADLMLQDDTKEFRKTLCKLAQKGRAAGIHIILSTQRPAANIIDGNIKANFPARLSCKTASSIDSRVVLDTRGAESLYGKGDALLKLNDCVRFQVAYTNAQEVSMYYREAM